MAAVIDTAGLRAPKNWQERRSTEQRQTLSGNKTESIYRGSAIVSEADLAEGVSRRSRPAPRGPGTSAARRERPEDDDFSPFCFLTAMVCLL